MVRTEVQRDLHVHHRVAGQHAGRQSVFDTLLDRRDELARHHTALDDVDELEVRAARLQRFQLEHDVTVLTTTTGLLDELLRDRKSVV